MFAIAITDQNWFEYLRENQFDGVINFWTPSPWKMHRLTYGDWLHFFLKSPVRKIAGGGCFSNYLEMNIQEAWDRYGNRNGCETFEGLRGIIKEYKKNTMFGRELLNHKIGCIELINCKYLRRPRYTCTSNYNIKIPATMQKFKYFEQDDPRISNYLIKHGEHK